MNDVSDELLEETVANYSDDKLVSYAYAPNSVEWTKAIQNELGNRLRDRRALTVDEAMRQSDHPEATPELIAWAKANFYRPKSDKAFFELMAILESRRRDSLPSSPTLSKNKQGE